MCVIRIYLYFIGRYQQFMSCAIRNPTGHYERDRLVCARDITTMKEYTSDTLAEYFFISTLSQNASGSRHRRSRSTKQHMFN